MHKTDIMDFSLSERFPRQSKPEAVKIEIAARQEHKTDRAQARGSVYVEGLLSPFTLFESAGRYSRFALFVHDANGHGIDGKRRGSVQNQAVFSALAEIHGLKGQRHVIADSAHGRSFCPETVAVDVICVRGRVVDPCLLLFLKNLLLQFLQLPL